jgi:hypothetical protein
MEGTRIFFLLCLIFTICSQHVETTSTHRKAYLRGGLLFEKHHDTPILVNPTTVTLYRHLNTTLLLQSNELLKHYTQSYHEFCDKIRNVGQPTKQSKMTYEYFVLPQKMTPPDAKAMCLRNQGKLPEVRSFAEKTALKAFAKHKNIVEFPAGVHYDNMKHLFVFNSNQEIVQFSPHVIDKVITWNDTTKNYTHLQLQSDWVKTYTSKSPMLLSYYTISEGAYYIGGNQVRETLYDVICAKTELPDTPEIENSLLLRLTAHSCIRDSEQLNATTALIQTEIDSFMTTHRQTRNTQVNTKQTCYTPLCQEIHRYFKVIDSNTDNITHVFHLKQYIIYKLASKNKLFKDMSFQFFMINMDNHEAIKQYMKNDPQAEIMYYMAKDLSTQAKIANTFKFTSTYFNNIQSKHVMNDFDLWIEQNRLPPQYTSSRKKRYIAALGGGLMLANAVTSATSGDAPLSWFGNVLSSTLGLATRSDFKKVMQHLEVYGTAISDLTINQEQLHDSYVQVRENVNKLQDQASALEYGTANMAIELDNRLAIKHMQFIIQLTLLKMANTFSFAMQNKASPYIFSQVELDKIALKYQNQRIFLSTDMNDVNVNLFRDGNNLLFTFIIPVLDDRSLFTFYETRIFPIFKNQMVYRTVSDVQYFALTSNTNEYSLLTETEYNTCILNKICQVSDVIHPIDKEAHCTLRSFQENKALCELVRTNADVKPFFAFYDKVTFYSAPDYLRRLSSPKG